jgi:tetratricopeptide (TPR) repeat protein
MFDLDPNFWAAHQTQAIVLVKQDHLTEALSEAQKSSQFSTRSNASLALLGHIYGKLGRRSEAEAIIKELEKRYTDKEADGRDLVIVYTGLDDKDKAFAWLERAFADHSVFLAFLKLEPLMERLHSDARWNDLERRVGLNQ